MSNLSKTLEALGPVRIAVLGAVVMGLVLFFIFIAMHVTQPTQSLLYSDLSTVDSAAVAAKLQETNVPFEISNDGSKVYVGETNLGKARMLLAEAGLPNGGSMGYELFDQQSSFGTTSFVQNINQLRAMQGELSRTISTLEPVEFAKVHIVLPERELFSRESREATASVTIKLYRGAMLQREQIFGIQNLVANAVPNLKADKVTIIDTQANLLAEGGSSDETLSMMGLKTEELRRSLENRLTNAVESMVGRIVGPGKVRANITANLNFDRISTNAELYDPESQVARSTQSIIEDSTERDNQSDVSVEQNLPGLAGDFDINAKPSAQSNRSEEITNFEISKTIQTSVRESGEIERLSVAVLVDGNYTTDEEGNKSYQARTEQELDQISALVRSAIGFDAARGDTLEVINMPFAEIDIAPDVQSTTIMGFAKNDLLDFAEIGMLAIMGILVVLLVLRPLIGTLISSQIESLEEQAEQALLAAQNQSPALAAPGAMSPTMTGAPGEEMDGNEEFTEDNGLIDMKAVEGRVKASTAKKVGEIITTHPNETVSVIRNWMSQE